MKLIDCLDKLPDDIKLKDIDGRIFTKQQILNQLKKLDDGLLYNSLTFPEVSFTRSDYYSLKNVDGKWEISMNWYCHRVDYTEVLEEESK